MKKLLTFLLLTVVSVTYGQYSMYLVPDEHYIKPISENITDFNSIENPYSLGSYSVYIVDNYYLDIQEITTEKERIRFYGKISKNPIKNTFTFEDMISDKVYKMVISEDSTFFYLDDLRSDRYLFKFNKSE